MADRFRYCAYMFLSWRDTIGWDWAECRVACGVTHGEIQYAWAKMNLNVKLWPCILY